GRRVFGGFLGCCFSLREREFLHEIACAGQQLVGFGRHGPSSSTSRGKTSALRGSQFLAGGCRILYNRSSVGGRLNITKPGSEVCHDRKGDRLLDPFSQIREGANRGDAGCAEGAARGVRASEPGLARPHQVGGRSLVGARHQARKHPLWPRSAERIPGMPHAADANGRGGLAASLRRLSKSHADDDAVSDQRAADRKHVKMKPATKWLASFS